MELSNEGGKSFVVLESFYSEDFKSGYEAGMNYTIRPGNEKLARFAVKWAAEGKIVFGNVVGSTMPATIKGVGEVRDKEVITASDVGTISAADLAGDEKK